MSPPSPPPALEVTGLHKRFGGVQALSGVSLEVRAGEVHALVGENGAGKSTLINLLVGTLQADSGSIRVGGQEMRFRSAREAARAGIAAVFQELSLVNTLSVAENIYANRQPVNRFNFIQFDLLRRQTGALMEKLGVWLDPDQLVGRLSVAERQMVEILKALAANPCVLLLDEPTSSLTQRETEVLFRLIHRLRQEGEAIVYISHHLQEVLELADRVTVFRDGRHVTTRPRAGLTEPDLVKLMVGRELQDIYGQRRPVNRAIGPRVRVEALERKPYFSGVSLEIWPGEIVGLSGLVGAGRTELGRALLGAEPAHSGRILLEGREIRPRNPAEGIHLGIAYVTEDRKQQGLFLRHSIRENLAAPRLDRFAWPWGWLRDRQMTDYAEQCRQRSRIITPHLEQKVGKLSGGNQQKVLMAAWTGLEPRFLIADEPTRGVDVGARREIYEQLRQMAVQGAAILLISSDLQEIFGLSDRILVMRQGRIVACFDPRKATEEMVIGAALGAEGE